MAHEPAKPKRCRALGPSSLLRQCDKALDGTHCSVWTRCMRRSCNGRVAGGGGAMIRDDNAKAVGVSQWGRTRKDSSYK